MATFASTGRTRTEATARARPKHAPVANWLGIKFQPGVAPLRCVSAPRRCFTLAELLIVIAILMLLTALLLSVLVKVREQGRRTQCANNLRTIGQGLFMYDQAYGRLPASISSSAHGGSGVSFKEALLRIKAATAETFVCPSAYEGGWPTSYELNPNYQQRRMVKGRGHFILASEVGSAGCVSCHVWSGGLGHGSRSNYLFFDGHVEPLRASDATRRWGSGARPSVAKGVP